MQRLALEAIIDAPWGPLRVISTHLEYYSRPQRMAQVDALRRLHEEACGHAHAPRPDAEEVGSPFSPLPRPASAVICGDLNFQPEYPEHARMKAPFASGEPAFYDAWEVAHPGVVHAPTVGVHETSLPTSCFDFVFVTADLAPRVRKVEVNSATEASDHQPVLLELV
jgi:endonuclease/exonuclease/phosphatase family metal-dependent hydrolase